MTPRDIISRWREKADGWEAHEAKDPGHKSAPDSRARADTLHMCAEEVERMLAAASDLEQAMSWLGSGDVTGWQLADLVDGRFELLLGTEHHREGTTFTGDTPAEAVIAAWKEHGR